MTRTRPALAGSVGIVLALGLVGCGAQAGAEPDLAAEAAPAGAADWPRVVEVGDAQVEIDAEPQRIVALSTETGDLALQLVGAERVAAVSTGSVTEGAGNQLALAAEVDTVLPPGTSPDPEQILSLDPDLVLLTERHDGEQDAAALLADTGIPSIAFSADDFQTIDAISDSVALLGEALGAEAEAAEIVDDIAARRAAIDADLPDEGDAPTVLLLMARGGQQMIQPAGSLMANLVAETGGEVVGSGPGAAPADPERIVALDPDVILVEDFRGAGLGPFQDLLRSPALADVAAIGDDRVHLVDGAVASDTAAAAAVDGLEEIAALLR